MDEVLRRRLDEWTDEALITAEQADAILRHEAGSEGAGEPERRRTPLVAEVLGYLGGALVLIAGFVAVTEFWDDLSVAARLALVGVGGLAVLGTGWVLVGRDEPAMQRLGGFLWLLSVAAVAFWVAVAARDGLGWAAEPSATAASSGALVLAWPLWARHRGSLQLIAAFGATVATLVTALVQLGSDDEPTVGSAIALLGVAWLVLARRAVLGPRRTATVLGAAALVLGVQSATEQSAFIVVGVLVGVTVLAVAVVVDDVILLGAGVVAIFIFVPQLVFEWFGDTLGAPLTLLLCGLILLGVALGVARLRSAGAPHHPTTG